MPVLPQLYRHSLALLTDLYQLTMAYGYWHNGLATRRAAFHLTFRQCPFQGQFAIACGLGIACEFLEQLRFESEDLAYLATLRDARGGPLFAPAFLEFLGAQRFECDLDAIPEGSAVFPHEPLVRVTGPLWQAQVIETALLTLINYQTLIATKAARLRMLVGEGTILEFGLRRAQGIDGGLSASRAAYVGGCDATSNVLAGKLYGIPVRGTHAHSWVMAFEDELEAFRRYAAAMPANGVLLVDTYDTLQGLRRAGVVGEELRAAGHELLGVRLDSGELGELSFAARKILDEHGLHTTSVVASNDLDEREIAELKAAGAPIDVWGIGTKLVTAYEQPALGGVYKLAALQDEAGVWQPRLKLSETAFKTSDPGRLQVKRYSAGGRYLADVLYDEEGGAGDLATAVFATARPAGASEESRDLLVPVFRSGRRVCPAPNLEEVRQHVQAELARLDPAVLQRERPATYGVGYAAPLHQLKQRLIAEATAKYRTP